MNTSSNLPSSGTVQNDKVTSAPFQIGALLSEAWQRVSGAKAAIWGAFFVHTILYVGLAAVLLVILSPAPEAQERYSQLISSVSWLLFFPLGIGVGYLAIRRSVDLPIRIKQIFGMYAFYIKLLGTMLLLFLLISLATLVMVGGLALILGLQAHPTFPGGAAMTSLATVCGLVVFYIALSLSFAPFLVVEKNYGILQSLKVSFKGFTQHGLKIMIAYLIMWIIVLISAIPFGIGLIWTFPMLMNLTGVTYRTLFGVTLDTTPLK